MTGLDIGSSKVAAVTARLDGSGIFEIIAHAHRPSRGVSRGVIVDLNEAVDAVSKVFSKLSGKVSKNLGDIYVNIGGEAVKGSRSAGMVPLSLGGREVIKPDMDRCVNAASTIHLPFDREIIHRIVRSFSIDDQPLIKNPLGLYASRLSCEIYIITVSVNHIQSIYKCVNDAGYDVKEIVFTGIADAASLLDKTQQDEGAALIDLGNSLTELSIFYGGSLRDLDIIPIGARDIKDNFRNSSEMGAILSRLNSRIQNFLKSGGKVSGVILAGGMVFTDGFIEFLEEKLPYPVKMGIAKDIRGDVSNIESVRLSTAIGAARYACEKHARQIQEDKNLAKRVSNKIMDIFNNYF